MKAPNYTHSAYALFSILLIIGAAGCQKATAPKEADDAPAKTAVSGDKADSADKADDALPMVKIETAHIGVIEKLLPLSGTLMAARDQEATIACPIAGVLDQFPLHPGDSVRKGELVAHLTTAPLSGQIQQARAGIAQYDIAAQQASAAALQQQDQTRSAILQAQAAESAAQANLLGAQATLTADQAAVANAEQTLSRLKALFDQGLVAQKDVEAAELAARTASAQVDAQKQTIAGLGETLKGQKQAVAAAEASRLQDAVKLKDIDIARAQRANAEGALASAHAQASLYTVRAPIGGIVTAVNAGVGESVDTTTKILAIANIDRLQLNVSVPSASSGALYVGQPLTFTVDSAPGRTFRAAIRTIGAQIDPTNGTVNVIAEVDNRDHRLKDDMSVHVGLVTATHRNAVLVPRGAVLFDAGATDAGATASVMKIDAQNTVHKIAVTTGITEGDLIEVTSGIKAGDRVASTGSYGLADGAKVKSADDDSKTDKGTDKPDAKSADGATKPDDDRKPDAK